MFLLRLAMRTLRPLQEADGELMALAARLRTQYPTTHAHAGVRVVPLRDTVAGPLEEPMRVMLGVEHCAR